MFIRDYSINVMCDCSDMFFYACVERDFDALTIWCMGA